MDQINEHSGPLSGPESSPGGEPVDKSLTPGHTGTKEDPMAKALGQRSKTAVLVAAREVINLFLKMAITPLKGTKVSMMEVVRLIIHMVRNLFVDGPRVPNEIFQIFAGKCARRPGTDRPYFIRQGEALALVVSCQLTKMVVKSTAPEAVKFSAKYPVAVRTHLGALVYLTKVEAIRAGLLIKPRNNWIETYPVAWDAGDQQTMLDGLVLGAWWPLMVTQPEMTEFQVALATLQYAANSGLCEISREVYEDGTTEWYGYTPDPRRSDMPPKGTVNRRENPARHVWLTWFEDKRFAEERDAETGENHNDDGYFRNPRLTPGGVRLLGKPDARGYENGRERMRIETEIRCYRLMDGGVRPVCIFDDNVEDGSYIRIARGTSRWGYMPSGWRRHAKVKGVSVVADWQSVGAIFAIVRGHVEGRAFTAVRFMRKTWGFGHSDAQMRRSGCKRCGHKPNGNTPCWLKARHAWQCVNCGAEMWRYKAEVFIPAEEFAVEGTDGKYYPILDVPNGTLIGFTINGPVVGSLLAEYEDARAAMRVQYRRLGRALARARKIARGQLDSGKTLSPTLIRRAQNIRHAMSMLEKQGQFLRSRVLSS